MSVLKDSILSIGVAKASLACGVSSRAIYKWLASGALPRTDYTGETNYAERLSGISEGRFTAEWLLAEASPNKSVA